MAKKGNGDGRLVLLDTKPTQGMSATDHDLLLGIAATVSRLDDEAEQDRDDAREDRKLLRQISEDLKLYAEGVHKLGDKFFELYQEKLAVPDPMKPKAG